MWYPEEVVFLKEIELHGVLLNGNLPVCFKQFSLNYSNEALMKCHSDKQEDKSISISIPPVLFGKIILKKIYSFQIYQ